MQERRLFWLLLRPSLSSSLVTLFTTALIMLSSGWLYVSHNAIFYDYFFGPNGINTSLLRLPNTGVLLRTWLLGNTATYYIVLVVTAIIAGLTVFAVLQGVRRLMQQSTSGWNLLHSHSHQATVEIHDLFVRLALRVLGCLGWCVYIVVSTAVLMPFVLLLLQSGIEDVATSMPSGLFNIAECFVALLIFIHVHIVFLRLVLLRPRLFGIRDIQLAELN
jgi:hypothetical protein